MDFFDSKLTDTTPISMLKSPILALTKVSTKTIGTFNEDDPASQKADPYRDLQQTDNPVARKPFSANKHGIRTIKTMPHSFQRPIQIYLKTPKDNWYVSPSSMAHCIRLFRLTVLNDSYTCPITPAFKDTPVGPWFATRQDVDFTGVLWLKACLITYYILSLLAKHVSRLQHSKNNSDYSRLISHSNS